MFFQGLFNGGATLMQIQSGRMVPLRYGYEVQLRYLRKAWHSFLSWGKSPSASLSNRRMYCGGMQYQN
jgi:hypothetical protein